MALQGEAESSLISCHSASVDVARLTSGSSRFMLLLVASPACESVLGTPFANAIPSMAHIVSLRSVWKQPRDAFH